MARKDRVVGYDLYQGGRTTHRGITNNRERRRQEHIENTGRNAYLKVRTGEMSREEGYDWERTQGRTRGYH